MSPQQEACRSREGAWIEIHGIIYIESEVSSRSREGAWIEIKIRFLCCGEYGVAPVRERGLKFTFTRINSTIADRSLP